MNSPLGLFDSGVGGLTVLSRLLQRHTDVSCLYMADTARLPYGEKQPAEIREIAEEIVIWLSAQKVSAILMACNTTNSLGFDVVKKHSGVPVFGLISAAVDMIPEGKRIGVLATPATACSGAYGSEIKKLQPGAFVIEQACPAFVPLIEAGKVATEELRHEAIQYVQPLLEAQVEVVVLGCTHYPLIMPLLKQLFPANVLFVDPAVGLVKQADKILGEPKRKLRPIVSVSSSRFCVTSDPSGFADRATPWLGVRPEVQLVSLRSKACFF